jgi:hypothetical protein
MGFCHNLPHRSGNLSGPALAGARVLQRNFSAAMLL